MNINKTIATLFVTGAFLLSAGQMAAAGSGYGTSNCRVIYGGGEVCPTSVKFTIDKKVQNPQKGGEYLDNLGFTDAKYLPGNQIAFKISIKNTGNTTIEQFTVVDTLPANLTFASGAGNYDAGNRTVTYVIKNLAKGETNEQTIVATIDGNDKLPQDQGVVCLNNKVKATDNSNNTADDAASFCIQRNIIVPTATPRPNQPTVYPQVPPKSIPNTGPEMLPLLGLIPAGLSGLILRRKSKIS